MSRHFLDLQITSISVASSRAPRHLHEGLAGYEGLADEKADAPRVAHDHRAHFQQLAAQGLHLRSCQLGTGVLGGRRACSGAQIGHQ